MKDNPNSRSTPAEGSPLAWRRGPASSAAPLASPGRTLRRVASAALLLASGLVACTRTAQPETLHLETTGAVGARLGTPLTGSYARGEELTTTSYNESQGLGPVYNKNACKWCHSRGGVGGAGDVSNRVELYAAILVPDGTVDASDLRNPIDETLLETLGGPVLHSDALGTKDRLPTQAEIDAALDRGDYRLIRSARVGNPIFGTGLLSAIPDEQIVSYASRQRQDALAQALGITGRVHYVDGSFVGRLGWKAQVPSTLNFIAGATVNEVGLSHSRKPLENVANGAATVTTNVNLSDQQFLDMLAFNNFVAPPAPINQSDSRVRAGRVAFEKAGCLVCHAASPYTTGNSATAPLIPTSPGYEGDADLYRRETGLHNRQVNAYSDLLLHDMGTFLADGFNTGVVGGDEGAKGAEWKTTALWGLRLKSSYLHDGRTNDLATAIRMHAGHDGTDSSSEAYRAVQNYLGRSGGTPSGALNATERENLIRFLKSL